MKQRTKEERGGHDTGRKAELIMMEGRWGREAAGRRGGWSRRCNEGIRPVQRYGVRFLGRLAQRGPPLAESLPPSSSLARAAGRERGRLGYPREAAGASELQLSGNSEVRTDSESDGLDWTRMAERRGRRGQGVGCRRGDSDWRTRDLVGGAGGEIACTPSEGKGKGRRRAPLWRGRNLIRRHALTGNWQAGAANGQEPHGRDSDGGTPWGDELPGRPVTAQGGRERKKGTGEARQTQRSRKTA